MESVDTTIINTAIPAMSLSLHTPAVNLKIALISYLLSLAIFIPISGWIADKIGIKRVFIGALIIFTAASTWCGFAHTLLELIEARTLQGLGGSLMLPVGRLILVRTFKRHELMITMNRIVMIAAIGLMLGPVLGGFITHYISWHWIFWVNIPIGLLTALLAWAWLDNTPPQAVHPLDKIGFVLFGSGLASLTFGLSTLSESNVSTITSINITLISFVLLLLYLLHSRRKLHPIVKTQLFKSRSFQVSTLGNLFSRLGFGGVPFLLPLLLQIGLGYPAQMSGLLIAPMALGVLLVKPFSLPILRTLGYKKLLILNTCCVGISLWVFTTINSETSPSYIAATTFFFGFLISLQYSGMNSLAYADIEPENLSAATSIISTLQQIAQSFGVAVSALLIRYYSSSVSQLSISDFHNTFFAMGILTLFSICIFLRLRPGDGKQMIETDIS